jgi:hypothetical protein
MYNYISNVMYIVMYEHRIASSACCFSIGAEMLQHAKSMLEDEDNLVVTTPARFHKLVTALRTAVANEYKLDKEQTSFNDILQV